METVKEGIRRNLADLLANSDKKQVDLARFCGVGRSAVTNWVSGESGIDIERIPAICDFFEISVDTFFGRAREMEPVSLTPDEEELLGYYRDVNAPKREFILHYARMTYLDAVK